MNKPNIILMMCDQLRFDAIGAMGNDIISTPNLDRLARRGVAFTNAYSTCPVCIPARYTIRTGREPLTTGLYANGAPVLRQGQSADMQERCGKYLGFTMRDAGYRTFCCGKQHCYPDAFEDEGFQTDKRVEEMWGGKDRERDAYAAFLHREHPEYDHIEQLHGERTDMYYMPQCSPFPAELTAEAFTANEAVKEIAKPGSFYGFISFVGPHPPCAPPIPYNRMYNPDLMPNPVCGDIATDHMDDQLPYHNYQIWANELNDFSAREFKARYYGEISYIDNCIGKVLDAVDARPDAGNTLILFCSDHGDHLGDHHAWQKESYFEASCHIPFIISWPDKLMPGKCDAIACHSDIFSTLTAAAGSCELRDGMNLLDVLNGGTPRKELYATHRPPGDPYFKIMLRKDNWKYIYMANGGKEQLFNLADDKNELHNTDDSAMKEAFRALCARHLKANGADAALNADGSLKAFPYTRRPRARIGQFASDLGITWFGQK